MFVLSGTKDIRLAYNSEHNGKRENEIFLLMIGDGEKWHYLAVKNLSRLLKRISSNHHGDYYFLGCFHSYSTADKLKKHKRLCDNHKFCGTDMSSEKYKILKFSQREKSLRVPITYYCDTESLIKNTDTCDNNPEQPLTTRVNKHEVCVFSIVAKSSLTDIKQKNTCYRGKNCIEKHCKELREWVMKIVNYEMKKMIPLTIGEKEYHENQDKCFLCDKRFCYDKKK